MSSSDKIDERLNTVFRTNESLRSLLMLTDSFHDFKSERGKTEYGSCVPIIDTFFVTIMKQPKSGDQRKTVLDYYNNIDIQFSKLEQSTRMYYEKQLPNYLDGTQYDGTIPVNILMSDLSKENNILSNAVQRSIRLSYDNKLIFNSISKQREAFKNIGKSMLSWLCPGVSRVGFSFDAQKAMVDDLMDPLNNITDLYAYQLVTPQNILDSAFTSFYVFPTQSSDDANPSRTVYEVPLIKTHSHYLSGKPFAIDGTLNESNPYSFSLVYDGSPITVNKNGPGVEFLANMILKCKEYEDKHICINEIVKGKSIYSSMTNPLLNIRTKGYDFAKICLDIKRLGDHEQANAVFAYRNAGKECVFVTGDTLSALYSRILGNPTIYVGTQGGEEEETSSSGFLLCYKGTDLVRDPLKEAQYNLDTLLSSVNYILFTYQQLSALASDDSDFHRLLTNMKDNVDTFKYKPEKLWYDKLFNELIRWRVQDIIYHLQYLHDKYVLFTDKIRELKTSIEESVKSRIRPLNATLQINATDVTTHGINLVWKKTANTGRIQSAIELIKTTLDPWTEPIRELNKQMQSFNRYKSYDIAGNTIYSFNNIQLYYPNKNKIEKQIAALNFNLDDIQSIINMCVKHGSGRALKSLSNKKQEIVITLNKYISSFYNYSDSDLLTSPEKTELIYDMIQTLNDTSYSNLKAFIDEEISKWNATPPAMSVPTTSTLPYTQRTRIKRGGRMNVSMMVEPQMDRAIEFKKFNNEYVNKIKMNKNAPTTINKANDVRIVHEPMFVQIYNEISKLTSQLLDNYPDVFSIYLGEHLYDLENIHEMKGGAFYEYAKGVYMSDYYYLDSYQIVARALYEIQNILKQNKEIDQVSYEKIYDIWFSMDALLTANGVPDYEYKGDKSKNDIRLSEHYHVLSEQMQKDYNDPNLITVLENIKTLSITMFDDEYVSNMKYELMKIVNGITYDVSEKIIEIKRNSLDQKTSNIENSLIKLQQGMNMEDMQFHIRIIQDNVEDAIVLGENEIITTIKSALNNFTPLSLSERCTDMESCKRNVKEFLTYLGLMHTGGNIRRGKRKTYKKRSKKSNTNTRKL